MFVVFAALLGTGPDASVDETEVQAWVRAARTGSPEAGRRLYAAHASRVFRAVRPLCPSDADAEDAVQETFARALTRLAEYQYRPESRFIAWLVTIAANVVRQRARTERRLEPMADAVADTLPESAEGPEAALLRRQLRELLLSALAELPERERTVVSLRYGAGLAAPEIADALRLSSANVRKICERQRLLLLEKLRPNIHDDDDDDDERPAASAEEDRDDPHG